MGLLDYPLCRTMPWHTRLCSSLAWAPPFRSCAHLGWPGTCAISTSTRITGPQVPSRSSGLSKQKNMIFRNHHMSSWPLSASGHFFIFVLLFVRPLPPPPLLKLAPPCSCGACGLVEAPREAKDACASLALGRPGSFIQPGFHTYCLVVEHNWRPTLYLASPLLL